MLDLDNKEFLENLDRSRGLYEMKWDVCVSSHPLQTLKERSIHVHLDKYRKGIPKQN